MRCRWTRACAVAGTLVTLALPAHADGGRTHEWPQFHGPRRDNKSDETGLLEEWPPEGPRLLWSVEGIGEGFSTVAIAGGLIYTTGNVGEDTVITALDLGGRRKWTAKNGSHYRRAVPGTRGTPTIDGDRLYHENADGDVICLDAREGERIWSLNILETFHGRNITWALAESLLIDGDKVICTPGGKGAGVVALDKRTGKTVWICDETDDKPGYCSPIVVDHRGLRQIVTMLARSIVGIHAQTGKLLWRVDHVTPHDENITVPIYRDGCILVSTQYTGSRMLRLHVDDQKASVQQVWLSEALDNQHGGIILVDGRVVGSCRQEQRGPWACLEFETGERLFAERGIGRGSLTYADGMLYMWNHEGTVALVRPTPRALEIVGRFEIPEGGSGPTWAHPVVCGGRLYLRRGDRLWVYDIAAK
ncbi:MAG: PQQ-binding-like beta-propeller repeat protein [Planctomycetes bacterium]|nr:PQQ-binding-like beta-propeller repeat protein [Planctomycetota bacterium]